MRNIVRIMFMCVLHTLFKTHAASRVSLNKRNGSDYEVLLAVNEPIAPNCSQPICTGPLSQIYCSGRLIHIAWIFGTQGTCPGDMMLRPSKSILEEFDNLTYPLKRERFQKFCEDNFAMVNYLKQATLIDWVEEPENIKQLRNPSLKSFALKLNALWKSFAREFVEQVHRSPDLFPVLPVSNAFIVPGDSFQLYYYWDSYWINKEINFSGLLFSNMTETVRHTLENLASIVKFHGFIPNSGNVQLSRRSDPPLFTQMVADYYSATANKTFLKEVAPWLDQEMLWWKANRTVDVKLAGHTYQLYQYRALSNCPRPENYLVDLNNGLNGAGNPEFIWSSIASACESGFDFSTRWFAHHGKHSGTKFSIRTNNIVPVDLNVYMAWNFITLANFFEILEKPRKAAKYRNQYKKLHEALDAVFWSDSDGTWFDFDVVEGTLRRNFYISNIFPLLLGDYGTNTTQNVLNYLKRSGVLKFKGGIPVSLSNESHEQWDYPNGWPPLIHMFVESLRSSRNEKLVKIAENVARKFIRTVYNGMINPLEGIPAACWEKYDVRYDDGRPGSGGEYPVQRGFGWTNGAVLDLIYKYEVSYRTLAPES
ncbi:unnamed protein product [Thelazia callipaeda]|uniref:Trehalase n=1 Tax=Thelazia callipaeda TaxID=103827 RepID=A0A0N5D5Z8_THECL|nr:unnamed protein product [Thelazia callipaeda]